MIEIENIFTEEFIKYITAKEIERFKELFEEECENSDVGKKSVEILIALIENNRNNGDCINDGISKWLDEKGDDILNAPLQVLGCKMLSEEFEKLSKVYDDCGGSGEQKEETLSFTYVEIEDTALSGGFDFPDVKRIWEKAKSKEGVKR